MPRTIFKNIVILDFQKMNFFEFCEYTNIRFFEIVYFKEGSGVIKVNGKDYSYYADSFFLFIPNDIYQVRVDTPTTGSSIKFLRNFFCTTTKDGLSPEFNDWFQRIEVVLNNEKQKGEFQFRSKSDKKNLVSLITMLCDENRESETYDTIIIQNMLSTILHLITRNSNQIDLLKFSKKPSLEIQEIINYIHHHIFEPTLLSNKSIAEKFNISSNYIGQYFKKHMDISLKSYKLNYKLKLVEARLQHTDMHLSQIALELGFIDGSHLDKTFTAYKGMSIGAFRATLE
ncbi:AraC-like DNA-binding protein [Aquimarina sp. MAR_2010_214]|uniref:helix-turn-helix domain-containing protein n=1 Tax=Aquimarina sp. MAR_2010_214 TaxID=1250026 RepID=UPI000C70E33B|nr:helix-turn-helix domain-containing protein [Aquimarina sp. MAR_2010_214]PKV48071.1 AraC-like DNA-binding protein [Aquimarina sp. MAR_2010_214]